jgi:hypothetical protein
MNQNLLIFNHIPKTAGTSLKQIITEQYRNQHCFLCYGGVFGNQTIKDRVDELNKQLLLEDNQPNTVNDDKKIKAVIGHVGFGLHTLIPQRQFQHLTFLRHPVERVISYYFDLNRQGIVGTEAGDQSKYIQKCLETKFLIEADNWQTRYLSGTGWQNIILEGKGKKIEFGQCDSELLMLAKENLKQHYVFGIQDKFIESIELISNKFGWQASNQIVKLNMAKKHQEYESIAVETIECIKELNWLDIALYDYAKEVFQEQVTSKFVNAI